MRDISLVAMVALLLIFLNFYKLNIQIVESDNRAELMSLAKEISMLKLELISKATIKEEMTLKCSERLNSMVLSAEKNCFAVRTR